MSLRPTNAHHQALKADFDELFRKHAAHLSAQETLAIAAQVVGMCIAYQDQRTMTREKALNIVLGNLEIGNEMAIAALRDTPAAGQG